MSKLIPLVRTDGVPHEVLGFNVSQNRIALPTWSYAFEQVKPALIIELGAYNGGFTTCLGVHAWVIGAKVHSFEIHQAPSGQWQALTDFLGIKFYKGDIFTAESIQRITWLIREHPMTTYVLCDNGDKKREFNLFADYLKPGDVIGAHDYSCGPEAEFWWPWREITQEDVAPAVERNNLKPFLQEYFDMAGWLVYRKS